MTRLIKKVVNEAFSLFVCLSVFLSFYPKELKTLIRTNNNTNNNNSSNNNNNNNNNNNILIIIKEILTLK